MRHKLMLAAAAALSALAMSAQEKTAVYCGDVPGSFKKAFEGMYKTAGTHKDLIVPESGKVQLTVWARLTRTTFLPLAFIISDTLQPRRLLRI